MEACFPKTKGMKRVLSDDEDSSPECLLQPEPVTDPYSSDDNLRQDDRRKLRSRSRLGKINDRKCTSKDFQNIHNLSLYKRNNGSCFKAEQSFFYFRIHFNTIAEEIPLDDKSLDECLANIFKFSSSRLFDEHEGAWKSETVTDLKERYLLELKQKEGFNWLLENDNIDWKNISPEKIFEMEILHMEYKTKLFHIDSCLNFAEKTKELYKDLSLKRVMKSMEDRCIRHNKARACIEALAGSISASSYLRNGMGEQDFAFYVPHDVVSDASALIPEGRKVVINSKPDGVFTVPYTQDRQIWNKVWLIPVEVYGPSVETEIERQLLSKNAVSPQLGYLPVKPQIQKTYPEKAGFFGSPLGNKGNDETCMSAVAASSSVSNEGVTDRNEASSPKQYLPPKPSINKLLEPEFVKVVRSHIAESLPKDCRNSHCLDKMTGSHIQQLLCVAKQVTTEQWGVKGLMEVLGLFVKNEYVYFSRLDIEKELLYYLSGQPFEVNSNLTISSHTHRYRKFKSPSVSYSNFRLDLTIAKHRLALMIFLMEYLRTFMKTLF